MLALADAVSTLTVDPRQHAAVDNSDTVGRTAAA